MKHCSKCFEVLPENKHYYNIAKKEKNGLYSECKGCRCDYRKLNKQKLKNDRARHYQENKTQINKRNAEYAKRNKDEIRKYQSEYYFKNKKSISIYKNKHYKKNKNYYKSYRERHRILNRSRYQELARINSQVRRSRKRLLEYNFTPMQWQHCLTHFNHSCAYCGGVENLEQEHVIPVSKGGHYTVDNIIPACRSCNASKNNKEFEEWYTNHESYSEERIIKIKEYLEHYLKTAN